MPEGYSVAEAKTAIEELTKKVGDFKTVVAQRDEEIKALGAARAETEEKLAKVEKALEKAEEEKGRLDKIETAMRRGTFGGGEEKGLSEEVLEYKAKMDGYYRHGHEDPKLSELGRKALAVQSDPDGGYWVEPDTSGRIVKRVFETSPLRDLASVQTISTDALEGVIDDDEAGFEWTGETSAGSSTDTPRIGKWRIPVHEMATRPKATQKLLEDAAVNIESWLMNHVVDKFRRAENDAFVNGDGVAKPRGFLTYAAAANVDVYERGAIGQFTSGASGVVDFDDVIEFFYKLKDEYRMNATWVFNRQTYGALRLLKDTQNRYLWEPSLQVGTPASILGRPIRELNDMPDIASNSLSIALADWSRVYQIVDRLGIAVLRDPYSSKPYVEFYTRRRVGGDVVNFDGIKILKTAA